jgi:ferrous iron transport protein B
MPVKPPAGRPAARYVVLTGNPNSGKTTLFNALTGLRAKVANYAGVTVERKEGRLLGAPKEPPVMVLDLPGTYSLTPQSLDEQIARDVLFHRLPDVPPPDIVVVIVDAFNLQRNLYFATQVIELGYPTLVALNMIDVARENGHEVDATLLSQRLGVPVFPITANTGQGVAALRERILAALHTSEGDGTPRCFRELPKAFQMETSRLAEVLERAFPESHFQAAAEAVLLLSDERFLASSDSHYPPAVGDGVPAARERLTQAGVDWRSAAIEARYARIADIQREVTTETGAPGETFSDRLDRVLTHRVWGLLIFAAIMALMFQSIFSLAQYPMDLIQQVVDWIGAGIEGLMPPGPLNDLLVKGVVRGVGAVVVFLPQICMLFLFIGLLEDTGYMARAAFLGDRIMSKVGLHGKSFIPMLSSFACAIPGIMATRTIENMKDRLVTILVAPLMSCSARLPVYTLLIAACIPDRRVLGFLRLQGLTMLCMYMLGIVVALFMAWLFKKTLLKSPAPMLIIELPPYKRPLARAVARHMWDRAKIFLRQAGTVILGINILLWFLASYPKSAQVQEDFAARRAALQASALPNLEAELTALGNQEASATLQRSFAGLLGHVIEPVLKPLGFDWKIGIGIVASFAAREVFVSTMALVYNVGELADPGAETGSLAETLRAQKRSDGTPMYTTLTGITLMVFYVFALQCASTVAVVRRETNSWKWPLFQWLYMGALAWVLAFVTYRGGLLLGLG